MGMSCLKTVKQISLTTCTQTTYFYNTTFDKLQTHTSTNDLDFVDYVTIQIYLSSYLKIDASHKILDLSVTVIGGIDWKQQSVICGECHTIR